MNRVNRTRVAIEDERIASLRARNAERLARFLDSKNRCIGIDQDVIQEQIEAKQRVAAAERVAEAKYADDQVHVRDMLAEFEVKRCREDLEELEVLRATWDQQRDVTQRDTFDLNDPQELAKDMPARIGDQDPRNGPSSMQKFDGEDLHFADRLRMQQAQMREWHASQTAEKRKVADEEVQSDMQWAALNVAVDDLRMENEIKALQERTQFNHEYREANRAQAMEKRAREARAREREAAAEDREFAAVADSAWINEKREHEVSMLGAHRVRPDHMKGFTQEQLDDIRRTQRLQMAEKQAEKEQEANIEGQWAENQRLMYAAMQEAEMAQLMERQQANQQAFEDTLAQRKEVFARNQRETARIRAAGFEESFFTQFGTSLY